MPETGNNTVISVESAWKSYGPVHAVKDLSFQVMSSECYGLLGPNGAGKTTMMKVLYAMVLRDEHPGTRISVFGYDPGDHELEIKYISGIVQQEDNLDAELTVTQNLMIYSRFYGISRREARSRIEELLEFMELTEKRDSRIRELSGGMKRRLTIARALINRPSLLILDEPTTGLDPQVRHVIWEKIRRLKKEGVTVLLTTHYMEEAFQLCDRLMIMHGGEKVLEGNPAILLKDEIEPWVLELFAMDYQPKLSGESDIRMEIMDGRSFLYSGSLDELESLSRDMNPGTYYLRQSNLEDLFLKITGRHLHE
jgi:lipooligosaccharide transport system ATP-binding protein